MFLAMCRAADTRRQEEEEILGILSSLSADGGTKLKKSAYRYVYSFYLT
jgi:hypothetical protein